tara:strand:- start:791 stop:1027 length:237 start_codon:yes stop_codon:yes gene_type:complete
MLPDEMEAEKNRKMLLSQADKIEILERNVRDLQQNLQDAYVIIKHKQQKIDYLKERCNFSDVENHYMENSVVVTREEV